MCLLAPHVAEAGDVDDDLAAMEEQALAELEADMAELDEAEANMANLEDEELDAVGDEVGPLYAPPAGFDDGIDNDDWDSEDEDENGWDVADTDDEFGSDDEMEDQIGDLHQNLFDLQVIQAGGLNISVYGLCMQLCSLLMYQSLPRSRVEFPPHRAGFLPACLQVAEQSSGLLKSL